MEPPDVTPKSLFPMATTPTSSARSGAGGSFATPSNVEFPTATDPEDGGMTAFGNRVQADRDLDLLDARVCHVRDVQYMPGSPPNEPGASPVVSGVVSGTAPITRNRGCGWRRTAVILLASFAVGALAAAVGVFFLTR
jgi:hypothetical protein